MQKELRKQLIESYNISKGSLDDMYNSKGMWKLRKDLIQGKLTKYCEGCSQCETSYKTLQREAFDVKTQFYL